MAETAAPPETEQPQQTATIAPDATVQGAAQPANVQTENKWPAPTIPEAPAPTQQAPKVLTPLKRHGLPGVLDEVGKWLAGTQGSEVYIDPDTGQRVVQHPPLTHAQQWARIGAEAARGAAAGMAAGKGAGNQGKAALAGAEAQDKASQELSQTDEANAQADYSRQRQAKMDKANQQVQQLQMTQMGLENARLGVLTNEAQEKLQNEQLDRLEAHGGIRIPGEYTSDNIQTVTQAHPDFFTDHFKYNSIEPVTIAKNGKFDHVEFWAMPKDRATQPVSDTDAKRGWPVYVPGDPAKNDAGHIEYSPIQPGEYAQGSYDAAMNAANTKLGTALKEINENRQKAAAAQKEEELAKEQPEKFKVEQLLNNARITEAQASAAKSYAEKDKALSDVQNKGAQAQNLGEAMAHNALTEDMVSTGQGMRAAVQNYLTTKYPTLDQKSVWVTADDRKRASLANSALENLDKIQHALAADPNLQGQLQGRVSKLKTLVGTNDPYLATINQALDAYGIAAIGAHGVRNFKTKEDAEEALLNGLKNGPAATKAAFDTMRDSLHVFSDKGRPMNIDGTPFNPDQAPPQPSSSGASVSLAQAMQLPANKSKSADEVKKDIEAHGHTVTQ